MIIRIEAHKYRCFSRLDAALGPYHVLAGANGSGKTTFLDIPALFSDLLTARSVQAAFLEKTPDRKTPRAVHPRELIYRDQGNFFALVLEARLPEAVTEILHERAVKKSKKFSDALKMKPNAVRYEIKFKIIDDVDIQVAEEHLVLFSETGIRPPHGKGLTASNAMPAHPPWLGVIRRKQGRASEITPEFTAKKSGLTFDIDPQQPALANVPSDAGQFPSVTWFRKFLTEQSCPYAPDLSKLMSASPPGAGKRLAADGGNLPWLVLDLQNSDPEGFAEWTEHVRLALPGVARIRAVKREEDHHAYFRIRYRNGVTVTSSGLSEGTLRILSLTLLPYLAAPPRLVMIEEPETGIHPQAIDAVLQSLKVMRGGQVWVSTHSPVVLANTGLEEALCMRLNDDDSVEAVRGDAHPRLKDWKGGVDIGTLFAAGVLG